MTKTVPSSEIGGVAGDVTEKFSESDRLRGDRNENLFRAGLFLVNLLFQGNCIYQKTQLP